VVTQSSATPGTNLIPEVISAYGHAWKKLWKPFWILLLIQIIIFAISSVYSWIPFLGGIISFFITFPLNYGMQYAYLKGTRGQQVEIADMFTAFKNYGNVLLAALLSAIFVVIGFIFLIIPGIFIACKLAFVPFIVMDKKVPFMDAIKMSWQMTGGFGWQVFLVYLLAIPVLIAGFICLGVGAIVASMWISMALASLYYAVDSRSAVPGPPPVATV
jgi:uncharacterized membrane protein